MLPAIPSSWMTTAEYKISTTNVTVIDTQLKVRMFGFFYFESHENAIFSLGTMPSPLACWIAHPSSVPHPSVSAGPIGFAPANNFGTKPDEEALLKCPRIPTTTAGVTWTENSVRIEGDICRLMRTNMNKGSNVAKILAVIALYADHTHERRKNPGTHKEFIDMFADNDGDKRRQLALLRLALNDVGNLVIRKRYGLDDKDYKTLGEIIGNMSISRGNRRKLFTYI
ncbi:sigma factor E [Artemisia annua]|uniref:Sigma factor E n=1 Tax=Artemisia annua TaxID=35608 RepID=A0A2U1KJR6_ARTAN|nr:sigma factor E [Artemisia annua]